jgi:hypothetical protein
MPKQPTPKKKSEPTNQQTPDREDIEAELPHTPAKEPLGEPTGGGEAHRPRPTLEPETD